MPGNVFDRISTAGVDPRGAPKPVPGFGTQIQDRAIIGFEPEANVDVKWTTVQGAYADGSPYSLRRPEPVITRPYAAFGASVDAEDLQLLTPTHTHGEPVGTLEYQILVQCHQTLNFV
ncbi:MAG: hypothetical protein O2992_02860 [Gemmatimonadetes bacterium]|jgi:hypothetical protein|nr:hypothetical protein [Gemmatimonadota bacterium]